MMDAHARGILPARTSRVREYDKQYGHEDRQEEIFKNTNPTFKFNSPQIISTSLKT